LFEASDRIGGHSNTVQISSLDSKQTTRVDTGFIVCNPITYPNILAFLDELKVPLVDSDMSFSVSRNQGEFEWSGDNLNTVFAQRENLNPFGKNSGIFNMLFEITRFHKQAKAIANEADHMVFDYQGRLKTDSLGK
jgi:predicted NAD/FAD-binding protein